MLISLWFSASAGPALAQDPESAAGSEPISTEEVVVTGSPIAHPADLAPVRVEVIDRGRIEGSGARDLGELLEEEPGVQVQQSFRGTTIQMQGLDPDYVLVLVDGERMPGRIGGAIDLGRFTLENLEQVEIVRGASSSLYGSDAVAGVLNLVTRRPSAPLELGASASVGGGERAGLVSDASAYAGSALGPFAARITGGFHWADPFRAPADESEASLADSDRATRGSAREQWSLGGQVWLALGDDVELMGRVEYVSRRLSGVDRSAAGAIFDRVQLGEQVHASLGARVDASPRTRLSFRATYGFFREQYLYDQRNASALDDVQDNVEHLAQLRFTLDHREGSHALSVGFEELFQALDSARLASPGDRFRLAPFAQDEWTLFDDDDVVLVVVPGFRVDADSQYGTQVSPKLAVRFEPVAQVVLRASYGSGFRAPSFQELLLRFENPSVGYVVQGNPELGAESSRSLQISVDWTPDSWLRLSANFFRNDIDGLISVVTVDDSASAGTVFSYDNVASAYTQGLESSVLVRPLPELTLRASYTLTDAFDGERQRFLEGRAMHRVTASAALELPAPVGLAASARMALIGERPFYRDLDADGSEELVIAGWIPQLDLRVSRSFDQIVDVFIGVDNVFDGGDEYLVLRPRTYYAGARARY